MVRTDQSWETPVEAGDPALDEVVDDVVVVGVVGSVEAGAELGVAPVVEPAKVGATATGGGPTCESARPTICQVSTVASTRAATHAAAIRHVIMLGILSDLVANGVHGAFKVPSRRVMRA